MSVNYSSYSELIGKLDKFIRKYYVNKALRGTLYWVGLSLAIFLLYAFLEHEFYFGTGMRKFLFLSYLLIIGSGFVLWVGMPLLQYFRLGKIISHEQAARIIGDHFPNVQDRLLNLLQLKKQADTASDPGLLLASIEQKTESIRPVPFNSAISLQKNRKYLKYAVPPLLLLLILLWAAPSLIKDSTRRIILNNQNFERAAPFYFVMPEEKLTVPQYEDYLLEVSTTGEVQPAEMFIDLDGYSYRMKKEKDGIFTYRFKNVHDNTPFALYSANVRSAPYSLEVIKKPAIVDFTIQLDYPGYTGKQDGTLSNIGDLVVPAGTDILWQYNTLNANELAVKFSSLDSMISSVHRGDDLFNVRKRVLRDESYEIHLSNALLPGSESIRYQISVVPDLFPEISVERFIDSTDQKLQYFVGDVSDDYGISKLSFNYNLTDEKGQTVKEQSILLDLGSARQFQFNHIFDIHEIDLKPGYSLSYYFACSDNDGVFGSKTSRTSVMEYKMPTQEEFEEKEAKNSEDIKESLDDAKKETRKLQEELRKMREKLLQEKDMDWQNKKELEKLMERRNELQKKLNNTNELFKENLKNQFDYTEPSEDIQEKQEKLEEMFEELDDEKKEEMMKKMEEVMEKMEKNEALEMMEDFQMDEEQMEKQLDRLMELFKQMELEYEIEKQVQKLEELAQDQEELQKETVQKDAKNEETQEDLQKEQEELNERFDDMQKDMDKIDKMNKELERPKNMEGSQEQMEKIDQDMENSKESLEQQENKKASQSQKNASQRMKDLAQQMSSQMSQGQMEQMQADLKMLRQLIENLITLSFDQEDLIDNFNVTNITTPRYVNLVQDQFKIKDDFKVVEDSLQALSKRVFQLESFISEKVVEIKDDLSDGIDMLEERKKLEASENQHRTMKNLNDLALMLSEVMQQMQQQMSMMMPGDQMCNNPGGAGMSKGMMGNQGNVPMDKISEGQQKLQEEMQGKKEGQEEGRGVSSEDFARMAAQQAALKRALKDLQQQKQQRGQGDQGLNPILDEMDKIETDLVNKRLTNEMLKRQEEILTRLLEAERAEREREWDNERKSKTAQDLEKKLPPEIESYIRERQAEIELLNTVSPALKPYYKFLVEEYYNSLKGE